MGPQTGYFNPQILMEIDIHAPGIDARGAAFAGVNLYVQLGRGRDYTFSATSAGQDIIDTFAVRPLRAGRACSLHPLEALRFRGRCLPMEVLERTNSWTPNLADSTPAGSETLRTERTKLGIVTARATVRGKPVAYVSLRSTYMHEVDSALGFADFNDPGKIRSARDFQRAAHKSATRSTGSTPTTATSPTSTRATTPSGPRTPIRACPWRPGTNGVTSTPSG